MRTNEIIKEFEEKICPHCIHYDNKDYMECKIKIKIDGEADCINYKCDDYIRRKRKNENNIIS